MTRNEILEVLADLFPGGGYDERWLVFGKRVAKASAVEEREACAKVVENYCGAWSDEGYALAASIRARGNA
jgi:hypothetical protein